VRSSKPEPPYVIANNLLSEHRNMEEPIFFKGECEEVKQKLKENKMLNKAGSIICIDGNKNIHEIVSKYGWFGFYYPYWLLRAQKEKKYHLKTKLSLEKHFTCLNGNPWPGRIRLLSRLYEENLLDDCFWTLNNFPQVDVLDQIEFNDDFLKLLPKSWDGREFKNESIKGFGDGGYTSIPDFNGRDISLFRKSVVNIIVETDFYSPEEDDIFLTGKLSKTIAMKMPFLLLCSNSGNTYSILNSLGFESFGNVWPENYMRCTTPETQIESMIETMRCILLMDKQELIESTKDVCNHNYEVLMNMKKDLI
tara:strand:+ start:47 stop:970 length:924 start_codon:yes stop_codon:yes gene_type:complete